MSLVDSEAVGMIGFTCIEGREAESMVNVLGRISGYRVYGKIVVLFTS